ncbi:MAG: iron chaperone [Cyclobacteriaceae bacterium]
MRGENFSTVDAYISAQPAELREKLETIRHIILKTVRGVEEKISYGMPGYKYHGVLLYFAAAQKHIGLYAMPSAIAHFRKELKPYDTAKGTIRFPLNEPLPKRLIADIVRFRKTQNEELHRAKQSVAKK